MTMCRVRCELVEVLRSVSKSSIGSPLHDPSWLELAPKFPKRSLVAPAVDHLLDKRELSSNCVNLFEPAEFPRLTKRARPGLSDEEAACSPSKA
eukprot:810047-Karenia_brevis.AAC.1